MKLCKNQSPSRVLTSIETKSRAQQQAQQKAEVQEGSKILNLESAKGGNTFLPASQCAKYELIVVARGWQESCVKCLSSTMLKKQR